MSSKRQQVEEIVGKNELSLQEVKIVLKQFRPDLVEPIITQKYSEFIASVMHEKGQQKNKITVDEFESFEKTLPPLGCQRKNSKVIREGVQCSLHNDILLLKRSSLSLSRLKVAEEADYFSEEQALKSLIAGSPVQQRRNGQFCQLISTIEKMFELKRRGEQFRSIQSQAADVRKEVSQGSYKFNQWTQDSQARRAIIAACGWDQLSNSTTTRELAINVFKFNFNEAVRIMCCLFDRQQHVSCLKQLKPLLLSLQNLQNVLMTSSLDVRRNFLSRKDWEVKYSDEGQASIREKPVEADQSNPLFAEITQLHQPSLKVNFLKSQYAFTCRFCSQLELEDPYLRLVTLFIGNRNDRRSKGYPEVLELDGIRFIDKIAFVMRFCSKEPAIDILQKLFNRLKMGYDLNSLCVFGPGPDFSNVIQNYIDQDCNFHVLAFIEVAFKCLGLQLGGESHVALYLEILLRQGLLRRRIAFAKAVSDIQKSFGIEPKQKEKGISIKCKNCSYVFNSKTEVKNTKSPGYQRYYRSDKLSLENCPQCANFLPNCSVCFLPLSVINPFIELQRKGMSKQESYTLSLEETMVWCQKCHHGGHYQHMLDWFEEESRCPVSTCLCQCR